MKHFSLVSIFVVLSLASFSQKVVKINSYEENVYPFEMNQTGLYFGWMKNSNHFSDIEIFGMGEATHGTKEFFELKAKTFEFLVTNYNYRVFGIEASYGDCCFINDYLFSGIGNVDSIMNHFSFQVWRTREVKELLIWIKNYNQQKSDSEKISFYGFDMQDIYSPVKYLIDFVKSDSLIDYLELEIAVRPVLSKSSSQRYAALINKDSKYQDTLRTVYSKMVNWMSKNESYLKKKYTNVVFMKLSLCIDNYMQAVNNWREIGCCENYTYRDSCMAYNILRIQKLENSKMFIWAHNGHVSLSPPPCDYVGMQRKPMGSFLKKELAEKYYSIGFIFSQGNFRAYTFVEKNLDDGFIKRLFHKREYQTMLSECSVPVYAKNTLTNAFDSTKLNAFFIDINSSDNPIFSATQYAYILGAAFYDCKLSSVEIIAKNQFDGLIYINKTSCAEPLGIK